MGRIPIRGRVPRALGAAGLAAVLAAGLAAVAIQDQINFRNLAGGRTLTVDGLFGTKTQASVRAFQEAMAAEVRGFRVDGVVGAQTWQALVSEALSG